MLGLRCCVSLVASEGYSLVAVQRFLLLKSRGSRILGLQQLQHMGATVVAPELRSTGLIAGVRGLG